MKLERLTYEPGAVLDFYEESFTALGALWDRAWHDRLEVVAEGRAAKLWNPEGALHACELHFALADATCARQENSLRRELERIDEYFENYATELASRAKRTGSENVKAKTAERLAAAKAEHARRRADQVARHEIRILPHLDGLLLVAEPAWSAELEIVRAHHPETVAARYVPRARRWHR